MTERADASKMDWDNLGFDYHNLPYRYVARYVDGEWHEGETSEDGDLHISEAAPALHYGQSTFEGLKAYRTKDGHIQLFRPDRNAKRMKDSAERLLMPAVSEEQFVEGVKKTVAANEDFVPPYGNGATMYVRPIMMGVGPKIGVQPSDEYIFMVFATPVGSYFPGGVHPVNLTTLPFDRAAHYGTGQSKIGGNYDGSLLPHKIAADRGFSDVLYLDPLKHEKIEETGGANFFAISKDGNTFITPKSQSILPSITKYSLLYLAEHELGMNVVEGDIKIDELDKYKEAGICGTAAVITPVGGVQHGDNFHAFDGDENKVGEITKKLYDMLSGIQFGDVEAPEGWIQRVK